MYVHRRKLTNFVAEDARVTADICKNNEALYWRAKNGDEQVIISKSIKILVQENNNHVLTVILPSVLSKVIKIIWSTRADWSRSKYE